MGMSTVRSFDGNEGNKEKEIGFYKKFISFLTGMCLGFFPIPFLYFVIYTTVKIFKEPMLLNDGMVILYIAILTGIYYILTKKTILKVERKMSDIIPIFLGFLLFVLSFYFF